ncbi:hypothetical protein [Desulfonema magnum]|uniref:Uncharacterized protein n=1 Tax=Desulfonema magnum TaxID=45655 RepID=A0A975BRE7_9BACT|nr:hypothetical protein [Desulfonema magnum]QTA90200.1 Uncharacterized protein dnm_062610 [Desulfonema magnum]
MIRKIFSKILGKSEKFKKKESDDVVAFARTIEKVMDETCLTIFKRYNEILLAESNVYIVPAVWGALKDGDLTATQKEIHSSIFPVITKILESLYQENMSDSQRFAIGYLVRGLFISKIIYMIEFYKNLSGIQVELGEHASGLEDIETWGHA